MHGTLKELGALVCGRALMVRVKGIKIQAKEVVVEVGAWKKCWCIPWQKGGLSLIHI